jgi:hypothetical protein
MPPKKSTHKVKVGNRNFTLRSKDLFIPKFVENIVSATQPQMRVLAEETRDLLIDKIMAGNPRGYPPKVSRASLPKSRLPGVRTERKPFPFDRTAPLTEDYLKRKVKEGKDPRILIATGRYLEHIVLERQETKDGVFWRVYIQKGRTRTRITFNLLARILEFGSASRNIKPRPHWRPTARLMRDAVKRVPDNVRAQALRETLREIK